MTEQYSIGDVEQIMDVKVPRLQEWIRRGLIIPTWPAQGRGGKTFFSRDDLYRIALFQYLLERGFNRNRASVVINGGMAFVRSRMYREPYKKELNWETGYIVNFEYDKEFIAGVWERGEADIMEDASTGSVTLYYDNENEMLQYEQYDQNAPKAFLFKTIIRLNAIKESVDRRG